jgi:hypothetical protein
LAGALVVRNLEALNKTFKQAPRETRLALRREYRTIAQPVQRSAESLAASRIRNLAEGSPWAKFRLGITQKLVYMAPKQKGVRDRRQRKKFAGLLMARAMEPALAEHAQRIEREFEQLMDRLTGDWNRGP